MKLFGEVSSRKIRALRKKWKDQKRQYREDKKVMERTTQMLQDNTPPSTPTQESNDKNDGNVLNLSGRAKAGRKRISRKRSATARQLKELEKLVERYKKRAKRNKTKLCRYRKRKSVKRSSPKAITDKPVKGQTVSAEIKKRLLFGEFLKSS